jgi:hypothetical protein
MEGALIRDSHFIRDIFHQLPLAIIQILFPKRKIVPVLSIKNI